ncbi:hypothetical protein FGO68_gene11349 [Halteria grandinella]|uniref:Uncharacterized protein n=1 Tax=Halteria grandinella TaxID=5974 RepID=A0A8J8T1R8_HALGN|nr:hypothetical protein FGO68_gene11349 [Halteria grandinella]
MLESGKKQFSYSGEIVEEDQNCSNELIKKSPHIQRHRENIKLRQDFSFCDNLGKFGIEKRSCSQRPINFEEQVVDGSNQPGSTKWPDLCRLDEINLNNIVPNNPRSTSLHMRFEEEIDQAQHYQQNQGFIMKTKSKFFQSSFKVEKAEQGVQYFPKYQKFGRVTPQEQSAVKQLISLDKEKNEVRTGEFQNAEESKSTHNSASQQNIANQFIPLSTQFEPVIAEERKLASFTFNKTIQDSHNMEIHNQDVDERGDEPHTFGQDQLINQIVRDDFLPAEGASLFEDVEQIKDNRGKPQQQLLIIKRKKQNNNINTLQSSNSYGDFERLRLLALAKEGGTLTKGEISSFLLRPLKSPILDKDNNKSMNAQQFGQYLIEMNQEFDELEQDFENSDGIEEFSPVTAQGRQQNNGNLLLQPVLMNGASNISTNSRGNTGSPESRQKSE